MKNILENYFNFNEEGDFKVLTSMLTRVRELHWWQKKLRGPLWLIPDSVFEGSASILIILAGFSSYFTLLSSCFYLVVSFFAKLQGEFVTLTSTWWQVNTLMSSFENEEIFHFCFYTTPLFTLYLIHLTFVICWSCLLGSCHGQQIQRIWLQEFEYLH